ncbi:hypothetical protein cypCar_00050102 [Cyprinus carpio]|nr:hypothetical protein cypCar_00050102 [Cyprinus carpio]
MSTPFWPVAQISAPTVCGRLTSRGRRSRASWPT